MTREEQIEQEAKKEIERLASHATLYKGTIDEIEVYEPDDMIDMFKLGAEWSREHLIDKACEWLFEYNKHHARKFGAKSMMRLPDYTINVGDFRKAMEERK